MLLYHLSYIDLSANVATKIQTRCRRSTLVLPRHDRGDRYHDHNTIPSHHRKDPWIRRKGLGYPRCRARLAHQCKYMSDLSLPSIRVYSSTRSETDWDNPTSCSDRQFDTVQPSKYAINADKGQRWLRARPIHESRSSSSTSHRQTSPQPHSCDCQPPRQHVFLEHRIPNHENSHIDLLGVNSVATTCPTEHKSLTRRTQWTRWSF